MSRSRTGLDNCLSRSEIASQRYVRTIILRSRSINALTAHQVPIRPTPDRLFTLDKPHFPLLSPSAQSKPNVDRSFLRQLLAILRIAFPSYRSPDFGIVFVH